MHHFVLGVFEAGAQHPFEFQGHSNGHKQCLALADAPPIETGEPVVAVVIPAYNEAEGIVDMGANVLYLLAVRGGMLAIVAVVASLYPASTVALAFTIDKERLTRWQAVGLGAAALALVLVSLSRQ